MEGLGGLNWVVVNSLGLDGLVLGAGLIAWGLVEVLLIEVA